jgi:hypothetical protein
MVIAVMERMAAAVVVASKCVILLQYQLQSLYGVGVDEWAWSIDGMTMTKKTPKYPGKTCLSATFLT